MIVTVIIFILILGLLIFVHEAGHFTTARRNGITCHEFGFGFPPRLGGVYRNAKTGKWRFVFGNREYTGDKTLYSLNAIPIGGFVRIKGEDGTTETPDSFGVKSAWIRFKVLIAGVFMNFVLAWALMSVALMIGMPDTVREDMGNAEVIGTPQVQVLAVEKGFPAEMMGISMGDVITKICVKSSCTDILTTKDLTKTVQEASNQNVVIHTLRGEQDMVLTGQLRAQEADGKGVLGIKLAETVTVQYVWYQALWEGMLRVISVTVQTLATFGLLIASLVSNVTVDAEVAGPVGIAIMTQQMRDLGIAYLLQFSAVLSINLAIINVLPIPALDGGRILFLLIEKIKGRPVNRKVEGIIHTVSFMLLIALMLFITVHDVFKIF